MEQLTYKCNIPVLLIIFNRLDTTKQVLDRIRLVKPTEIFIAADGPRTLEEKEKCDRIREYVLANIDWETKIYTLFREKNLGCRLAVSGAINWFFGNVEKGIILEDDCLPALSFFKFCEELLIKYQDDNRMMHIGGANHQNQNIRGDASYYYSRIAHIWGWATWRRAWKLYDMEMKALPDFIFSGAINKVFDSYSARLNYLRILLQIKLSKNASTWDYQWSYSVIKNKGICITPNQNLISNIGFGTESAHPRDVNSSMSNVTQYEINTIIHPEEIEYCVEADNFEGLNEFKFPDFKTIANRILAKKS